MAMTITKIPAKAKLKTEDPITKEIKKKRVAGYARVSTDHEEQLTSYEAQLDYYTNYIKAHDDWEFVGMYADEGISGTGIKKRKGFQTMIDDALAGKIDLIITKSVSRFARNTVDSLTTIRKLKDKGVEVYFEKENIRTLDSKGELLITLMSSLSQEESRSISENTTWGQRRRFANGKASVAFSQFLGYDKGPDGSWVINEEQAKVVKKIYRLFLQGLSYAAIATTLTKEGIPTPGGKTKWGLVAVRSILTNEKYKGDALLQKCYTVDFLTKKQKVNDGEVPQYYVKGHHPAIIDPETFDLVQIEVQRRANAGRRYSAVNIFSSKVICGDCGNAYGPKVWHSNQKNRSKVWRCNRKYTEHGRPGLHCKTPNMTEEKLKDYFVKALNQYINNKDEIINNIEEVRKDLCSVDKLEEQKVDLANEMNVVSEMIEKLMDRNARVEQDQEEYEKQYSALEERYSKAEAAFNETSQKIQEAKGRDQELALVIDKLKGLDGIVTEFDAGLWGILADKMTIYRDGRVVVSFKDGTDITV